MPPPPFVLFGPQHLAALLTVAVLGAVWCLLGRRWERLMSRLLAAALATFVVVTYLTLKKTGDLSLRYDLPLEICDLEVIFCVWCLLAPHPLLFEIAYFWGLAGTLMALITPDLAVGFPAFYFIQFFAAHGLVVIALCYMAVAGRLRIRAGAMWRAFGAINVYVVVVGGLDKLTGWNYGYLCAPPVAETIVRFMGPWPEYLVGSECLALLMFFVLDVPWRLMRQSSSSL